MEQIDFSQTHFEELAAVISTWLFHTIFGFFNISIFVAIYMRYGTLLSFVAMDNSYYSVLLFLVFFNIFKLKRVCFQFFANSCLL